jgi:hypothetical protein
MHDRVVVESDKEELLDKIKTTIKKLHRKLGKCE